MPCAVKSSFKAGLHISLFKDKSQRLRNLFRPKMVFTLQIGDHFFLNLYLRFS
jgi:hypothetical protein